jgi:hypothetical protein
MSKEALFLSFLGMEPCQSFVHIIKVVENIHFDVDEGSFHQGDDMKYLLCIVCGLN